MVDRLGGVGPKALAITSALAIAMGLVSSLGCGGGGGSGGGSSTSGPSSGPGFGPSSSSGSNNTSSTGSGSCSDPGQACSTSDMCCMSGQNVGPLGSVCITQDNSCHAKCEANNECSSGCCATVTGESFGACADPMYCASCKHPGDACTATSDCCMDSQTAGPYGATCLSDDNACHSICHTNNECSSGCCAQLQGVNYGACAAPNFCGG